MKRAMTIYYDEDSGEMEMIKESDSFKSEDSLLRADVLKDVIYRFLDIYNKSSILSGIDTPLILDDKLED